MDLRNMPTVVIAHFTSRFVLTSYMTDGHRKRDNLPQKAIVIVSKTVIGMF